MALVYESARLRDPSGVVYPLGLVRSRAGSWRVISSPISELCRRR
jgi:hypothetical protein